MSRTHHLRIAASLAAVVLALGMTACGQDEEQPAPAVTVTATVEPSEPVESVVETSEPAVETSAPAEPTPSQDGEVGPNDESGVIDVTVQGDQGILALQHSGTAPTGEAGPTDQKLITGPGGCFALTNQGKPQLLVFPDDATFVLQEGKPSATIAGTEHFVGQQFAVASTTISKASVAGIPDRCMKGSDDTVVVVS